MSENEDAIRKVISEQLVPELRDLTRSNPRSRLLRVEAHLPNFDPLRWLEAQPDPEKIFWSDREQAFSVAGIGVIDEKRGEGPIELDAIFADLKKDLRYSFPNLRYYGGFRFDCASEVDERWRPFGSYRFIVPEIEVGRKGNRTYVAVNMASNAESTDIDKLMSRIDSMDFPDHEKDVPLPTSTSRKDTPDREAWTALIEDTLGAIGRGELEKLVLARESFYEFDAPLPVVELMRRLLQKTAYSFHFLFQLKEGLSFLGASPERLYKRRNTYLQSEALAGTRKRGTTPEEDAALGAELLANEKETREHRHVTQYIRDIFDERCRAVRGGDHVELLILRHCQHLLSRFEGMLSSSESDAELLSALHPTPAVGGVPTGRALKRLREMEPFDRGWYAAPVGWIGYDATEFAVAIRSGLLTDNTLSLYSGAGIVKGSGAEEEWDEIENKLNSFAQTFEDEASLTAPPSAGR